jgi:hypothetical protein
VWGVGEKTYDLLPRLVFFGNFPFLNNKKFALGVVGNLWRLLAFCSHFTLFLFSLFTPF